MIFDIYKEFPSCWGAANNLGVDSLVFILRLRLYTKLCLMPDIIKEEVPSPTKIRIGLARLVYKYPPMNSFMLPISIPFAFL